MQFPPTCSTWQAHELAPSTPLNYPFDTAEFPAGLLAAPSTPQTWPQADCLPAGLPNFPAVPFPPTLMPGRTSWLAIELATSL
jgi:hypothetical protein